MNIENQIFEMCLRQLKQRGSVLLLPTETVYGLICDWNDLKSRKRIRKMKSREAEKPFQMLAPDLESIKEYGVKITPDIKRIVDGFCPGPITIIAKSSTEDQTVGFRIPAYPFILDLMKESGKLFAATSANIAGEAPAVKIADALESLEEQPDLAVDAGKIVGDASTVIDMTGKGFKILREGPVTEEEVRGVMVGFRF